MADARDAVKLGAQNSHDIQFFLYNLMVVAQEVSCERSCLFIRMVPSESVRFWLLGLGAPGR